VGTGTGPVQQMLVGKRFAYEWEGRSHTGVALYESWLSDMPERTRIVGMPSRPSGDVAPFLRHGGGSAGGHMSNHATDGSGGKKPELPPKTDNNPWNGVENLLGFLLAGFGAVLSFLGLRSTEVTTVLRNYPSQASLIAFLLLLGVLAAVLTVAIDRDPDREISWTIAAATILALFGVGAFVIYAIPVGTTGILSKVLGLIFISAGIIISVISLAIAYFSLTGKRNKRLSWASVAAVILLILSVSAYDVHVIPVRAAPGVLTDLALVFGLAGLGILIISTIVLARGEHHPRRSLRWLLAPRISPLVILIAASVILIGISAYGAMRLEAQ
jgi:hypothetical protein